MEFFKSVLYCFILHRWVGVSELIYVEILDKGVPCPYAFKC